jgi:hypothetical protein
MASASRTIMYRGIGRGRETEYTGDVAANLTSANANSSRLDSQTAQSVFFHSVLAETL